ncbi:MAG: hypothetical protein HRU70_09595 [Phycisphaeraceae bacterium]|nr:MAG: hypothetical protein HRU70_09595 [Phycisphaeraceae bacterium]
MELHAGVRGWAAVAVACACGVGLVYWSWTSRTPVGVSLAGVASGPIGAGARGAGGEALPCRPFTPQPTRSVWYNESMAVLRNEIGQKREWTVADAAWVAGMMTLPMPTIPEGGYDAMPLEDLDVMGVQGTAFVVYSARVYRGYPIAPEGRALLDGVVAEALGSESERRRLWAVATAFEARLNERPPVRTRLEAMVKSDPSAMIRSRVRRGFEREGEMTRSSESARARHGNI